MGYSQAAAFHAGTGVAADLDHPAVAGETLEIYGLGLGEGYASMSIGTPTGDGITKTSHFARPLQCSVVGDLRIA